MRQTTPRRSGPRERGHVVEGRRVMEPDQEQDETGEDDPVEGLGDRPQGESPTNVPIET